MREEKRMLRKIAYLGVRSVGYQKAISLNKVPFDLVMKTVVETALQFQSSFNITNSSDRDRE